LITAKVNLIKRQWTLVPLFTYWDDEDKMVRLEDSVVMNFKADGLGFRRMEEVVGQGQTWFVPAKNPKDEVNKCCMEHDKCYRCNQVNVFDIVKSLLCGRGKARPCDDEMCQCLRQANCNSSPTPWQCELYRRLAASLFCFRQPISPPHPRPRPIPPPHDPTDSDGDGVPDAYDWDPWTPN